MLDYIKRAGFEGLDYHLGPMDITILIIDVTQVNKYQRRKCESALGCL